MECYKVEVRSKSSTKQETLFIVAPNYASVEKIAKRERYSHDVLRIERLGIGFTYHSLYEVEKPSGVSDDSFNSN